jgi:hypothetical protein
MQTKYFCFRESRDGKILLSDDGKVWKHANKSLTKEIKKWLADRENPAKPPVKKSWIQRLKEWFI